MFIFITNKDFIPPTILLFISNSVNHLIYWHNTIVIQYSYTSTDVIIVLYCLAISMPIESVTHMRFLIFIYLLTNNDRLSMNIKVWFIAVTLFVFNLS